MGKDIRSVVCCGKIGAYDFLRRTRVFDLYPAAYDLKKRMYVYLSLLPTPQTSLALTPTVSTAHRLTDNC